MLYSRCDVNIPINLCTNNVVQRYTSLLESYGFVCSNNIPTRPVSRNILDHFICKSNDASRLRNDTILIDISDHLQIITSIRLFTPRHKQMLTKNIVDHIRFDRMFSNYINNIVHVVNVDNCINEIITTYNQMLVQCTKTFRVAIDAKNEYCPTNTAN